MRNYRETQMPSAMMMAAKEVFQNCYVTYLKKCFKFIYLERDRQTDPRGGRQREREKESQAGSTLSAQSPTWGLNSQTMRS